MASAAALAPYLTGIPVVRDATERDALFPSPAVNQRVDNLGTGRMQRFNGTGWVDTYIGGAVATGTPAALVDGVTILTLPTAFNFTGRVSGSADASTADIHIPELPVQNTGGVVVADAAALKFIGAGVSVTNVGGVAVITVTGGGAVPGVNILDEGTPVLTPATGMNFLGAGVTVTDAGGGVAAVTIPGLTVKDEGTTQGPVASLNFTGTGVTANVAGVNGTVAIPGYAGAVDHDLLPVVDNTYNIGSATLRFASFWALELDLLGYAAPGVANIGRRNGTPSAISDVVNGDELARINLKGRLGGTDKIGAYIRTMTETPSSNLGAPLIFGASPNGSPAFDVLQVDQNGLNAIAPNMQIGTGNTQNPFDFILGTQIGSKVTQASTLFSNQTILDGNYPFPNNPANTFGRLSTQAGNLWFETGNPASRFIHEYVSSSLWYLRPDTDAIGFLGKTAHGWAGLYLSAVTAPGAPAGGWVLYTDTADGHLKAKAPTGTVVDLGTP